MTALHQKYRPTTFDQVIGQKVVISSLQKVVKDNRAKAFLFTGPSGTGKTTLARILANTYCGSTATPHNTIEIDAATSSGADAIRELIHHTHYRAIGASPIKVVIIDECHRLSSAAWTVLLKPIEEPPKHVFWCLCTTELGKVPKTIQTRCLRYELKPVSEDDLLQLLLPIVSAEKFSISDEALEAVAGAANGSPRQALVYLEACSDCTTANQAASRMRSAYQSVEAVDLARFLLKPNGRTWAEAIKLIKLLEELEAESIRIVVTAYITSYLLNTQSEQKVKQLLYILECFSQPYQQSDRMAPLLLSVGLVLGLNQ